MGYCEVLWVLWDTVGYCCVLLVVAGFWGVGVLRIMGVIRGEGVTMEYCSVLGDTAGYMVLQYPVNCGTLYPSVPCTLQCPCTLQYPVTCSTLYPAVLCNLQYPVPCSTLYPAVPCNLQYTVTCSTL